VKITADTNVLVRALVADDPAQAQAATNALARAETVAVGVHALCELTWVLHSGYGVAREDIAAAIKRLIETSNVQVDRPAVEAGLAALEAGGDFADGVIAFEGAWLGADTFVSFDRKAVSLLKSQGQTAQLL
jgi:predicted nucleic-acid-binding protein